MQQVAKEEKLLREIFGEPSNRIQALFLKGVDARRFVPHPSNIILTRRANGVTGIILMSVETAPTEAEARARTKALADSIDTLEPDSFGPVIQQLVEHKTLTDFRTGVVVPAEPSVEEFRAQLLSTLPLPREVVEALEPPPP